MSCAECTYSKGWLVKEPIWMTQKERNQVLNRHFWRRKWKLPLSSMSFTSGWILNQIRGNHCCPSCKYLEKGRFSFSIKVVNVSFMLSSIETLVLSLWFHNLGGCECQYIPSSGSHQGFHWQQFKGSIRSSVPGIFSFSAQSLHLKLNLTAVFTKTEGKPTFPPHSTVTIV